MGPRRAKSAQTQDVPGTGECVLVHPESGRILALNASGAAVWELLDGRSVEEIAEVIASAAGVEEPQAQQNVLHDVATLVDELRGAGFLDE